MRRLKRMSFGLALLAALSACDNGVQSDGASEQAIDGDYSGAPRVPGGVEMPDILNVLADGADDIAFHDLHVVDVIKQFHAG